MTTRPDWQDSALCAQTDPRPFFPKSWTDARFAKGICEKCFVQADCLEWALAIRDRFAVLGGMTPPERRAELVRRGLPDLEGDLEEAA